jgi:hypothetical protein
MKGAEQNYLFFSENFFPHGRLLVIGITFREILCCQFQSGETKIKTWQD